MGKKVGESLPIRKKSSACGSLCILRTEDKDPVLSLWQRDTVGSSWVSHGFFQLRSQLVTWRKVPGALSNSKIVRSARSGKVCVIYPQLVGLCPCFSSLSRESMKLTDDWPARSLPCSSTANCMAARQQLQLASVACELE